MNARKKDDSYIMTPKKQKGIIKLAAGILKNKNDLINDMLNVREAEDEREPYDYTEWQKTLWEDKSVKNISEEAMQYRKNFSE